MPEVKTCNDCHFYRPYHFTDVTGKLGLRDHGYCGFIPKSNRARDGTTKDSPECSLFILKIEMVQG